MAYPSRATHAFRAYGGSRAEAPILDVWIQANLHVPLHMDGAYSLERSVFQKRLDRGDFAFVDIIDLTNYTVETIYPKAK